MKKIFRILCIIGLLGYSFVNGQYQKDTLYENFRNPPEYTKPWVYWYWISDHISEEGIKKDIEAMAAVGIREALIGNIDEIREKGTVKALTDEWYQMLAYAVKEGKRCGVDIGLFNCPGWSQSGGPWIKPHQSMRYLSTSELQLKGPQSISIKLTTPDDFQDVALLAFPAPKNHNHSLSFSNSSISSNVQFDGITQLFDGEKRPQKGIILPKAKEIIFEFNLRQPAEIRSLTLYPSQTSFKAKCELQLKEPDGPYRTVSAFFIDRRNNSTSVGFIPYGPICETFPTLNSQHYRLIFKNIEGTFGFSEIELSAEAKTERFIEKQLGKLWPTPAPQWDAYMWKDQPEVDSACFAVSQENILNLSAQVNADGYLNWDVPEGDWIVQRIGMVPTGQKNSPASVEARGLEVDKMNKEWVEHHFDSYIGEIIGKINPEHRTALKHIVADSYETGAQNWTDGMAADFKAKYHYDPLPYLPVLSGFVIGSADISNRFLWDLRRCVADRISYHYVGTLKEKSNTIGTNLWLENYGHWGFPGEFLQYGGQSDEISGEFWTGNDKEGLELRAAASAAHGYGKKVAHAEAFTSGGPMWQHEPRNLKRLGDWAATKGINHFILHVYIHQPYEDKIPGINAWFGIEFNRHNTWFNQSKEWIDYLSRTHYLLQQGHYVADVAYFTGEDAPKMTGIRHPELPDGFNFDYVNAEMIHKMEIQNNRFTLPDGMSYKVLVLPPQSTMRPEVLSKIKQLVLDGGIIIGPLPKKSPSLENYPLCDKQIANITKEMWGKNDEETKKKISYGKGFIYTKTSLTELFSDIELQPDIENLDSEKFPWIHRSSDNFHAYYISNQTDQKATLHPIFRVDGMQPELWDPITKESRNLPNFEHVNGRTLVPIELEPSQSYFIVFRKPGISLVKSNSRNFNRRKEIMTMDGNWNVSFKRKGEYESKPFTFNHLEDWTEHDERSIKYFSGTARYEKVFDAPKISKNTKVFINLGYFNNLATVRLNGYDLGLVWASTSTNDVSKYLKRKGNAIEIEVTNTWHNQLVRDAQFPPDQRSTHATSYPDANSPLLPSGLIGPVSLEIQDPSTYVESVDINASKSILAKPDTAIVSMTCTTENATIHYSTDGTLPTKKSPKYTNPIQITDQTTVSAIAFKRSHLPSTVSKLDIDSFDPEKNLFNYAYYEGTWNSLPNFKEMVPVKTGRAFLDLAKIREREDHFAIKFDGFLNINVEGKYTFYLSSDDGSKLIINGIEVINNDGSHGTMEKSGTVYLTIGKHPITIEYFDNINEENLKLDYRLNKKRRQVSQSMITY